MKKRRRPARRFITAWEFRALCLKLVDEVAETGAEIVITKNAPPASRLVPRRWKKAAPLGADTGRTGILVEIASPMPRKSCEKASDTDDDLS